MTRRDDIAADILHGAACALAFVTSFALVALRWVPLVLVVACQQAPGSPAAGWEQVGVVLGSILTGAGTVAGGRALWSKVAGSTPDIGAIVARIDDRDVKVAEVLGRLDERTKTTEREVRRIRDTQHDHAQTLTELALKAGATPPPRPERDPDAESEDG